MRRNVRVRKTVADGGEEELGSYRAEALLVYPEFDNCVTQPLGVLEAWYGKRITRNRVGLYANIAG